MLEGLPSPYPPNRQYNKTERAFECNKHRHRDLPKLGSHQPGLEYFQNALNFLKLILPPESQPIESKEY